MANGALNNVVNDAAAGAAIGTVIMPGFGTAVGGAVGGLVSIFSGGPKAQQHQANVGGQTIDARQIYEQITGGPGTGSLQNGATAASQLQSVHSDRVSQIAALNQEMDAAWQGSSGQAAQAGAHPLETWLNDSAQNLGASSQYIGQQAQDFSVVSQKVQPLPENPPSMGFLDHFNPWSDKDSEIDDYNRKGQQNVDAFNAYYQASSQNAAGMPQYSAWTGNPLSDGPGQPGSGVGSGVGGGGAGGGGGIGGGGGSGVGDLPRFSTSTPSTHSPSTGGGADGSGGLGSGGSTPPLSPAPPGYPPTGLNDNTSAAGYPSPSTDFSGGFGPGSGGFGPGGGGAGGSGVGGVGGVGGGAGFGAVGAFGPGAGGSLSAGASTGAGSGAGGGSGGGTRAGAAGAAGRSGTSGMGGMHGGRGEGSENEEHETKYLVGEDPNDLFGTDELTAPPVIGE